jgi:hypothetical protein
MGTVPSRKSRARSDNPRRNENEEEKSNHHERPRNRLAVPPLGAGRVASWNKLPNGEGLRSGPAPCVVKLMRDIANGRGAHGQRTGQA